MVGLGAVGGKGVKGAVGLGRSAVRVLVLTAPGLESELQREVSRILPERNSGGENVKVEVGSVETVTDEAGVWALCLSSRLASGIRMRMPGSPFTAKSFSHFKHGTHQLPWHLIFPAKKSRKAHARVSVQAACTQSALYHSGAVEERLGASLGRLGAKLVGEGDGQGADLRVFARLDDDLCTVSVDAGGSAFYKRGYRTKIGKAPMRENLAAACADAALRLSECESDTQLALYDPFCGAGTMLAESLLARCQEREAEASWREGKLPLEYWSSHRSSAFEEMRKERDMRRRDGLVATLERTVVVGGDIHEAEVRAARSNLASLVGEDMCTWSTGDFAKSWQGVREQILEQEQHILLSNLPYGMRSNEKSIATVLRRFQEWVAGTPELRHVFVVDGSPGSLFDDLAAGQGNAWREALQFSNGGSRVRLMQLMR